MSKMNETICQLISFDEAKSILKNLRFAGFDNIVEDFINETHILSTAERLDKANTFKSIPNWDGFEAGDTDFLPLELLEVCFKGLDYQDEKMLIITMESYTSGKVFLVDFCYYEQFAKNYATYIGENLEFVQPMDYIFLLLNQKVAGYINHEGTCITLTCG